jgi:hypothetical protein
MASLREVSSISSGLFENLPAMGVLFNPKVSTILFASALNFRVSELVSRFEGFADVFTRVFSLLC